VKAEVIDFLQSLTRLSDAITITCISPRFPRTHTHAETIPHAQMRRVQD
jgi:hypothetical protein